MTTCQLQLISKRKPLTISLAALVFTTTTLLTVSPIAQAEMTSKNVISSSPSTTTSDLSTTNGVVTPASTTTSTTMTGTPSTQSTVDATSSDTTSTTKITSSSPSTPVDQPNMTDNQIIDWASKAAQLAYTYDFKNYPKQIPMLQDNFTPEGWKAFNAALKQSNNLTVVQNRKLVASATPTGKAVLIKEGIKNGVYTWKVQLPMQATYESESRFIRQNLMVTMLVARTTRNPKGVGITHFVAVILPSSQLPVSSTATSGSTTTITNPVQGNIYNQGGASTSPTTTTTPGTNSLTPGSVTTTPSTVTTPSSVTTTPNTVTTPGSVTTTPSTVTTPGNVTTTPSTVTTPGSMTAPSTITTPGSTTMTPNSVSRTPSTSVTTPSSTGTVSAPSTGTTGTGTTSPSTSSSSGMGSSMGIGNTGSSTSGSSGR